MCRTGSLVFQGTAPSVSIANSGTGTVYVSGVSASVSINLSGIGNAAIDAASSEGTSFVCLHSICQMHQQLRCLGG